MGVSGNFGVNTPNGSVGVSGWLHNAVIQNQTAGILAGFTPKFDGLNVYVAGGSNYNACIGVNTNADYAVFAYNGVGSADYVPLIAPNTTNQSIVYALVAHWDSTKQTNVNNSTGTVEFIAVPGNTAAVGEAVPPSVNDVFSAVHAGYVCVLMTCTINYGVTNIDSSMINNVNVRDVGYNYQWGYMNVFKSNPRDITHIVKSSLSDNIGEWDYRCFSDGRAELWITYQDDNLAIQSMWGGETGQASSQCKVRMPFRLQFDKNKKRPMATAQLVSCDGESIHAPCYALQMVEADKPPIIALRDKAGTSIGHPIFAMHIMGKME